MITEHPSMYKTIIENDITVFFFNDKINSYYEEFAQNFDTVISSFETDKIIIDFSEIQYINSAAIGILVRFIKHLNKYDLSFATCSMDSHIYNVFRITALLNFIHYKNTREACTDFLKNSL